MLEHGHLNIPLKHTPILCSLSTLWAGHTSHIFPLKQPYFYTHVESMISLKWTLQLNYHVKKLWFCFAVWLCTFFYNTERQQLAVPSSSSLYLWLYRLVLKLSHTEQSWVCLISIHEGSLSLFFWSPFSCSSSSVSFLIWKEPPACRTHGTHRDSQWHNDLSGLFLIPFPMFSKICLGFFYCLWLISLSLHTHNETRSLCWVVIAKLKHLTVYA